MSELIGDGSPLSELVEDGTPKSTQSGDMGDMNSSDEWTDANDDKDSEVLVDGVSELMGDR